MPFSAGQRHQGRLDPAAGSYRPALNLFPKAQAEAVTEALWNNADLPALRTCGVQGTRSIRERVSFLAKDLGFVWLSGTK